MFSVFDMANQALEAVTGFSIRMYDVVREYTRNRHRREQLARRNLRRARLSVARAASNNHSPVPSASTPQPVDGPLVDRKRTASDAALPMISAKRHDNGEHKSSPWAKENWLQQHQKDLPKEFEQARQQKEQVPVAQPRIGSITRWQDRKQRSAIHRFNPYKRSRRPSPSTMLVRSNRVSLVRQRQSPWDRIYGTPARSESPEYFTPYESTPAQQDSIHMDIDEETLKATDFTPKKMSVPGLENEAVYSQAEPPTVKGESTEEKSDREDDDAWMQEDEKDTRALLRSLQISHDDEGYKVPINGRISQPTQTWNEEHRRKLLREAATAQQTPSKSPKYRKPSVSSYHSDEEDAPAIGVKQEEGASASAEEAKTEVWQPSAGEQSPKFRIYNAIWGDKGKALQNAQKQPSESYVPAVAKTESDSKHDIKDGHNTPVPSIPLAEIQNLSIQNGRELRTPKARIFENWRNERITRTQKVKAEREASKNAYPMVPLSKNWDDKVRHAVNNGHGRFEAKMFNKCVPEYSNDPTARSLWLDDAVINDYVAMIAKHGSKDDRPTQVRSVSALSSFFYTKISAPNPNYASCNGMLKRAGIQGKNLLECEKVFIPINKSYHWTLAVIEPKVPEGEDAKEYKRKITVYNSMGSSGGQQVANTIYKWIQHELGASFKAEEWAIHPAGRSPQQSNSDDCGVFTITTARQIMLGKYTPDMYDPSVIDTQRRRIVAELVNGGLLNKEDSES